MIKVITLAMIYGLIGLFNWSANLNEWGSFSIFVMGFIAYGVIEAPNPKKKEKVVFNNLN